MLIKIAFWIRWTYIAVVTSMNTGYQVVQIFYKQLLQMGMVPIPWMIFFHKKVITKFSPYNFDRFCKNLLTTVCFMNFTTQKEEIYAVIINATSNISTKKAQLKNVRSAKSNVNGPH